MSGKGSRPRPLSVNRKTFDKNWDKIFKTNKKKIAKTKPSKVPEYGNN